MAVFRQRFAWFDEQQGEDDVADAAGQPDGQEEEAGDGCPLAGRDLRADFHEDMEK